jgi:phenylalanyl-tRNA synthetase beta chain
LHPKWQQKYELPVSPILFELDCDVLLGIKMPAYSEISRFPPVIRDLAVTVGEGVTVQSLVDAMWVARGPAVQAVSLFDVYRGKGVESGQKSLAFRVVIQDTAKTLTDEEADAAMATLTEVLESGFGAKLRA